VLGVQDVLVYLRHARRDLQEARHDIAAQRPVGTVGEVPVHNEPLHLRHAGGGRVAVPHAEQLNKNRKKKNRRKKKKRCWGWK